MLKVDDQNIKLVEGKGVAYKVSIAGTSEGDTVNNSIASASINLLDGNNRVFNRGKKVSIVTGAGNDSVDNRGDNVTVLGGSGDDSIGNYANGYINGKLVFDDGGQNVKIYGGAGNDSIENTADNVSIFGGAGNDSIHGGNGKDTLWGDAGNDKLWGGGLDTFIFTANEGTDRIFDYETGDILKILNADGSDGSFRSSKYSGGDLTLTINGGGKIVFKDVSANTNFNINGTSYTISGSKLK